MRPYDIDLRQRVLAAYQRGESSIRDLADDFEIAPRTVESWLVLARETARSRHVLTAVGLKRD